MSDGWMNSVRILRLRPDDTLVVSLERMVTAEQAATLREQIQAGFPTVTEDRIVILAPGVDLSVLRAEAAA